MISLEQYRCAIGTFLPRLKKKVTLPRLSTTGRKAVMFFILFSVSFLLRCGDIESNPGPTHSKSGGKTRQSTLSNDGSIIDHEPSNSDILAAINSMTNKLDALSVSFEDLNKRVTELTNKNLIMEERVSEVVAENKELEEKITRMDQKLDDLENRSRRDNLIFHGIKPESDNESASDCEELVRSLIKDKLGIDAENMQFERAHRLRTFRKPSPIIVKFSYYKDRQRVFGAKRNLRNSDIFISEDFSVRVRETRKRLGPICQELRNEGKRVLMVFDYLLVDGQRMIYDAVTGGIRAHQSQGQGQVISAEGVARRR